MKWARFFNELNDGSGGAFYLLECLGICRCSEISFIFASAPLGSTLRTMCAQQDFEEIQVDDWGALESSNVKHAEMPIWNTSIRSNSINAPCADSVSMSAQQNVQHSHFT